jgi:hypothetical protein
MKTSLSAAIILCGLLAGTGSAIAAKPSGGGGGGGSTTYQMDTIRGTYRLVGTQFCHLAEYGYGVDGTPDPDKPGLVMATTDDGLGVVLARNSTSAYSNPVVFESTIGSAEMKSTRISSSIPISSVTGFEAGGSGAFQPDDSGYTATHALMRNTGEDRLDVTFKESSWTKRLPTFNSDGLRGSDTVKTYASAPQTNRVPQAYQGRSTSYITTADRGTTIYWVVHRPSLSDVNIEWTAGPSTGRKQTYSAYCRMALHGTRISP